jgi:hypothetical protein
MLDSKVGESVPDESESADRDGLLEIHCASNVVPEVVPVGV